MTLNVSFFKNVVSSESREVKTKVEEGLSVRADKVGDHFSEEYQVTFGEAA